MKNLSRLNLKELKEVAKDLGASEEELKGYNSKMGLIVLINKLEREINNEIK